MGFSDGGKDGGTHGHSHPHPSVVLWEPLGLCRKQHENQSRSKENTHHMILQHLVPCPPFPCTQVPGNGSPSSSVSLRPPTYLINSHVRPTLPPKTACKPGPVTCTPRSCTCHSCGSFLCQYWGSQRLCSLQDPKSHEERGSGPRLPA